jgi:hypothetical protein
MGAIFLSYASEDRDRLDALIPLLERAGSVWWDRRIRPGSRWDSTIEGAMNEAECMVVVWTRAALESQWVREEAREGLARGVLVPVLLDDIRPPLGFREIEAAVLHDWDGSADHPEAQLLLQSVISVLEKKQPAGAPKPPVVASIPAPRAPAARPRPAPVPERTTWKRTAPAVAGALVLGLIVWIAVGANSDASDSAAQAAPVEEIPAASYLDILISNHTALAAAGGLTQGYVIAPCDAENLTHRGGDSTQPVNLHFVNPTIYHITVARLNADGTTEEASVPVPTGESRELASWVGDFWVARSGDWCMVYGAAADNAEIIFPD